MNVIELFSLSRRFGDVAAVNELTYSVRAGEIFGLLGPNGAGKSTVIKMLTTLLPPTSGSASVCGYDLRRRARDVRGCIGYVPQLLSADGMLTGYENLLMFAKLYGLARRDSKSRVAAALESAGLQGSAKRLVRTYSGGMIRRLEVAMALVHQPRVLFLDEPTIGLDPLARHAVWQQIQQVAVEQGTTVLMTTHLMDEADLLCDRIAIMNAGRMCALGAPEQLKISVGRPDATLDDVFAHYTGETQQEGGQYREVAQTRRTATRLG